MKYTNFKGTHIGKSAVDFFDKLAILESSDNYKADRGGNYIGRYQLGIDILKDLKWIKNEGKNWNEVKFLDYPIKTWGVKSKRDLLNCPEAQDDIIMSSMRSRWKHLEILKNKLNNTIFIPTNAKYICMGRKEVKYSNIAITLEKKRSAGYIVNGDYRGQNILLDASGLVASSHLCGQGAIRNAIENNFFSKYGIPVDANNIPFLFYHENLKFFDLSVILGVKPSNPKSVVLENKTNTDKEHINQNAQKSTVHNRISNNSSSNQILLDKNNQSNSNNNNNSQNINDNDLNNQISNVHIFQGQSSEENNKKTEYNTIDKKQENNPAKVFINENKDILINLYHKFNSSKHYNKDYIKFLETKTNKQIYDNDKNIIFNILKNYNNIECRKEIYICKKTKQFKTIPISYFIAQTNFDFFRGKNFIDESIKLQDVILFLLNQVNEGVIELINLENILKSSNIDLKNLKLYVPFREREKWIFDNCYNMALFLDKTNFFDFINQVDKNGSYNYPYIKIIIDKIFLEFIKIQTNFKKENEIKHYDNYEKDADNILNCFFIKMIYRVKKYFFLENSPFYLFNILLNLGNNTRVTTFLEQLILNKNNLTKVFISYLFNFKHEKYSNYYNSQNSNDIFREKDNEIIHKLFESSKNLLEFSTNYQSLDIYAFYEEFFDVQNEFKSKNRYFVNNKCILKCSCGVKYSLFKPKEGDVSTNKETQMTISDTNICPFIKCVNIKKCNPSLIGKWSQNDNNTLINNEPALISDASIKCMHGGIITINKPGQNVVDIIEKKEEITENPLINDQYCSYKAILDFSDKINTKFMQSDLKKKLVSFRKNKKNLLNLKKITNKTQTNKNKIITLENLTSDSREENLKKAIWSDFISACDYINNNSFNEIDNYNFSINSNPILCDYKNKKLYSAYLLPCIVYGYLNEAGNLLIHQNEKNNIKNYINNIQNNFSNNNEENNEFDQIVSKELTGFTNINKNEINQNKEKQIIISDKIIEDGLLIGKSLYNSIPNVPNKFNILSFIQKKAIPSHNCPLSDEKRKELCPYIAKMGERFSPWVEIAMDELNEYKNVTELKDPLSSKVREYHKIGGNNSSYGPSTPWCASFVNWCLYKSNFKYWKSASSQAALKSTEMRVVNKELFGGILVLTEKNQNHGHVGFIVGQTPDLKSYICLGGNQNNGINFARFRKTPTSTYVKVSVVIPKDYEYTDAQYLNENDIISDIKSIENVKTR